MKDLIHHETNSLIKDQDISKPINKSIRKAAKKSNKKSANKKIKKSSNSKIQKSTKVSKIMSKNETVLRSQRNQ